MRVNTGRSLLTVLCLVIPAHFTVAYLTMTVPMVQFDHYSKLRPIGSPFDYRMLPALLWRVLVFLASRLRLHPHLPVLNPPFTSNEGWFISVLTFLSLTGAVFAMRKLLRSLDEHGRLEWLALLLPLMAYFNLILVLNRSLYYPYDVTALLFFTLLISAAYRGRVMQFALFLVPAILNKETAFIAILAFAAFQFRRERMAHWLLLCGALFAEAAVVRGAQALWIRHACGCGAMNEVELMYNAKQLANPLFWLSITSVFAYGWLAVVALWKNIPVAVRRALIWVLPPWCCAMLYAGILREVRIFSELSALVLLAIATGLQQRFSWVFADRARTQTSSLS